MPVDPNKKRAILSAILDADNEEPSSPRIPRQKHRIFPEAYPDYSKSLVSQNKSSPTASAILESLGYGSLGTVLGAMAGRMSNQDNNRTAMLAVLGGLLGGSTGFYSGKKRQESENSRLLFLRRMGVDNPGELEAMSEYPGLARKITDAGTRV